MKSFAVVAASPIAVVPTESACPACSTIPVATRFTRATGDCLRDEERLVEERLLPLLLALLPAPPRDELLDALFFDALVEPPRELLERLDALPEERLEEPPDERFDALFDAPPFDALFEALFRDELLLALLRVPLLPLLRPPLLLRLPPLLRALPPEVRDADLRDADLREPDLREEERDVEPPDREPALRLELLRDDFFVAMLDSETRLVDQLRDSKQESRTNVEAARVMLATALSSGAIRRSHTLHFTENRCEWEGSGSLGTHARSAISRR